MKIQAVNSVNSTQCCQPIKQVEFAKRHSSKIEDPIETEDSLDLQNPSNVAQKYDIACRIAAYYKMQYENLLKDGSVVA